jgi:DNA repair protein RecO (recombination protein O)
MPTVKATALVLRTTDWSESSRIATLWTREFGKVRALAKGGRRLKSNFESALDLLNVCGIVLLLKSSGSLDLLTEAQVVQRFPRLRTDLEALYAAYYLAELLADWTEENDPHPGLFDEALATLEDLGGSSRSEQTPKTGQRILRFEMVFLRELGFGPALVNCAACEKPVNERGLAFSASAGGVICPACQPRQRERRPLSPNAWRVLRVLADQGQAWRAPFPAAVHAELRQALGQYIAWLRGRRPRLLPYLES